MRLGLQYLHKGGKFVSKLRGVEHKLPADGGIT